MDLGLLKNSKPLLILGIVILATLLVAVTAFSGGFFSPQ